MLVKNPLCLEEESSQDPPLQNRKEAGFLIERKVRYIVYFVCATKTRSAYTVPAAFQSVRAKVQIVIVSRSWPDVRVLFHVVPQSPVLHYCSYTAQALSKTLFLSF